MDDERIQICIRVKPPQDFNVLWEASGGHAVRSISGNDRYLADEVFVPTATNHEVFEKVGKALVDSTLCGYNTAICAYGQSGSGKTHTLLGTDEEDGLVSHVFRHLFDSMANKQENERTFLVQLQVCELYCEKIRDLLGNSVAEPMISEENNLPQVNGVLETAITTPEQAIELVNQAQANRAVGETVLNDQSSRSHAIIRISVESSMTVAGQTNLKTRHSVMTIVDLAGSENAALATGVRMREGNLINQSLFHLTKVINLLTDKKPPSYIPFRDSKLTRILKPALGGNSKTMMICCIDPENQDHTARTLKFSQRVKMVKSCAMVNEAEEKGKLGEVLEEMERLKEEMKAMKEEKEAREKQDRIRVLNAQLIGGHRDVQEAVKPVRTNRRMTWAPGALAKSLGRCGSLSPVAKKSRPLESLEELDDTRRTSDPSVTSISVHRISGPEEDFISNKISLSRSSDGAVDHDEIDKLRQDGLELEMKVRQLESEKTEILTEKTQQASELEEKTKELEKQLRVAQETNENLKFFERRLVESECELEETKRLIGQEKAARELAENELNECKASSIQKLAQLDTQVTELTARNKSLEDRINHGEMTVAQRERLVAHGEKLAEEAGALRTQLKSLQELYDEEVEHRKDEEKRRERLAHEIKDAETVAGNEKEALLEKLESARRQLASIEEESVRKEKAYQEEIAALKRDLALNADDALAQKDSELLALKEINNGLLSELAATKAEAEQTRVRVVAEVAGEVKKKMEETEETIKQLHLENVKLKQNNAALMEHAEESTRASQSSEELRGTVSELRAQLTANEETIALYKERAANAEALEKKLSINSKEIQKLTNSLETKTQMAENLVNRVNQYRRELSDQSLELVSFDKEKKEIKAELEKVKKILEEKDKLLMESDAKIAQAKAGFDKEKATVDASALKAKEVMENITRRNMAMESDLDRLKKELAEAKRREDDGFQERSEAFSVQIHKLEDEKRALERSLAAADTTTKDLKKQLDTKQIITDRCLKESVDLRAALELSNSGEKDRQLTDLKRKMEEMKRKLADAEDANMAQEQERRKLTASAGDNEKMAELVRQLEATRKKLAEAATGGEELAKLKKKLEAAEKQNMVYAEEKEVGMTKYMNVKKENRALLEKLNKATAVRSPLKEKKAV